MKLANHESGRPAQRHAVCVSLWIGKGAGVGGPTVVAIVTKIEEVFPSRTMSAIFYSFNLQGEKEEQKIQWIEAAVGTCEALFYIFKGNNFSRKSLFFGSSGSEASPTYTKLTKFFL
jgi:hypothetical protein